MELVEILTKLQEKSEPNRDRIFQILTNINSKYGNDFAIEMAETLEMYVSSEGKYSHLIDIFRRATDDLEKRHLKIISTTLRNYADKPNWQIISNFEMDFKDKGIHYMDAVMNRDIVLETVEMFDNLDCIIEEYVGMAFSEMDDMKVAYRTDLIKRYKDRFMQLNDSVKPEAAHSVFVLESQSDIRKVFELFEKYQEKGKLIIPYFSNPNKPDLDELLTDVAFKEIVKNPEKASKIALGEYAKYRKAIDMDEVPYEHLDKVRETEQLVFAIHEKRGPFYFDKVRVGFYAEMNRAINQSNDRDEQLKYLKEYCNDVQRLMKDGAWELMVISDE